jgi:hypothetical protein
MLVGYTCLATCHGALRRVLGANSASGPGIGVISSAMPVVLTERSGPGSSIGMRITVRAIGGRLAGAAFAALLTPVTISDTGTPREPADMAVWLTCGLAALLSLVITAAATRGARPAKEPESS